MENIILHILKINLLAALCIVLVTLLSHFLKNKYSSLWRYLMWLIIAVFLLVPINPVKESAPVTLELSQNEYRISTGYKTNAVPDIPVKTNNTTLLLDKNTVLKASDSKPAFNHLKVLQGCFLFWLTGAAVFIIYRLSRYRTSLYDLKRWCIPQQEEKINVLYDSLCFDKHIKNPPALMTHFKLQTPILAGLRNPCLYLPDNSYTEKELEFIFAHELCHYKRRDLWYKMLLLAVNTIYWFNPFLYFMTKEAEKDVEYLCDSQVIFNCSHTERSIYNHLLLKTAAAGQYPQYLSAGLNDHTTAFKERIRYMMKAKALKKGILPVALTGLLLLFSNILLGCIVDSAPLPIEFPPIEEITSVQQGSIKIDAKHHKSQFTELMEYLEEAEPLDKETSKTLHRQEAYTHPVIFRYEDKTKDFFYFFKENGNFYVETGEGNFYKNNDFGEAFGLIDPTEEQATDNDAAEENIQVDMTEEDAAYLKECMELETRFETLDTTFCFTTSVLRSIRDGNSEESAVTSTKENMLYEQKQYLYAVNNGYQISDEELDESMEANLLFAEPVKKAYEKICAEAGTTYEEHLNKNRENFRKFFSINKLREAKRQEFRAGNDTINGKEYWDTTDYYNGFLLEVLYPEAENYDMSDYLKELDEAETYYRKNYSQN